jgi:hypothetical protein
LMDAIEGSFVGWNASEKYLRFSLLVLRVAEGGSCRTGTHISLLAFMAGARSSDVVLAIPIKRARLYEEWPALRCCENCQN